MKQLEIIYLIGAVSVLTGCSPEPASNETNSTSVGAADTATAAIPDTAATDAARKTTVADSTIQVVQALTLHAIGDTPAEMRFDQDTLEAKAGAFVKLQLINDAHTMPMVHNVVFTQPGKYEAVALAAEEIGASGNYVPKDSAVVAASPMALPGQTIELEFTAPRVPGAYEFVCTYPGHWQRMHGKFIVK